MVRMFLIVCAFACTACTATPTALPEDFTADFEF